MTRRGRKKGPPKIEGDTADPRGLGALLVAFLEHSEVRGYSERTLRNRRTAVNAFNAFCAARGITQAPDVTRAVLERYQRHLFEHRTDDGRALTFRSQCERLSPLRTFFAWLSREHHVLTNPAADLVLPKRERRLPRFVLTHEEAELVLAQPDVKDPLGIRDRAMLEVLYSTGIRRRELISLCLSDVDKERGTLLVRQGKGRKDRMVPIGERAIAWTERYLVDVRPLFAKHPDDGVLFLSVDGEPLSPNRMSELVRRYVDAADIGKQGSCHLFRHSMATVMLDGGADVRFIQAMLGHADLSTTEIYTRVAIRKLQEVHARTHPSARLGRSRRTEDEVEGG